MLFLLYQFGLCVVRWRVGGSPVGGSMGVYAVRVLVPPAVSHDLARLLWDSRVKGIKDPRITFILYSHFFATDMLTCYMLWVPLRGGAHVLLLLQMPYRGGRLPMCPSSYTLFLVILAPSSI
jgi:hypothetical protein